MIGLGQRLSRGDMRVMDDNIGRCMDVARASDVRRVSQGREAAFHLPVSVSRWAGRIWLRQSRRDPALRKGFFAPSSLAPRLGSPDQCGLGNFDWRCNGGTCGA